MLFQIRCRSRWFSSTYDTSCFNSHCAFKMRVSRPCYWPLISFISIWMFYNIIKVCLIPTTTTKTILNKVRICPFWFNPSGQSKLILLSKVNKKVFALPLTVALITCTMQCDYTSEHVGNIFTKNNHSNNGMMFIIMHHRRYTVYNTRLGTW